MNLLPDDAVRVPPRPASTASYSHTFSHVAQRLRERHGLTIGLIEYTRLCLEMAGMDLMDLRPLTTPDASGRVVLLARLGGQRVPVLWCTRSGVIVTVYQSAMQYRRPGEAKAWGREHRQRVRRRRQPYKRRSKHRESE